MDTDKIGLKYRYFLKIIFFPKKAWEKSQIEEHAWFKTVGELAFKS